MLPAQQRLDAVHASVVGANLRLVVTPQLVVRQRGAQFLDQVVVVVLLRPDPAGVVDDDPARRLLGVRHRRLDAVQQIVGVLTMIGAQRDRDARLDLHGDRVGGLALAAAVQFERCPQRLEQRSGACPRSGDVDRVSEQDRELVAARCAITSSARTDRDSRAATWFSSWSPTCRPANS